MIRKIAAILFLAAIVGLAGLIIYDREKHRGISDESSLYPAQYYEKLAGKMVRCNLCPNRCILSKGQVGVCKARKNIDGELYSLVYGKIASAHIDPIEKKPFYHFLPGTKAYSIATTGCNLRCSFCQNWQIAQVFPWEARSIEMTPEQVVEDALKSGAKTIAFTYNEPSVFYEYMLDIAKLAHQKGLKTVVVSAGYINPEPLRELLKYIDAYKIDFKAFNEEFYYKMTAGRLQPVLEAMKVIKEEGVWLEIVNLLIPGENDREEDIRNLVVWVRDNLGPDVPLHFLRFHPDYKLLNLPPTPIETIKKARRIALDLGMKYVYTGNIPAVDTENTYCSKCGAKMIERRGYFIKRYDHEGKCSKCGESLDLILK